MIWKMVTANTRYVADSELLAKTRSHVSTGEVEVDMEVESAKR